MPIIRTKRPESNFIIVSKEISDNASLSWAARGLLIHLLGKPDNWRVSLSYLVTQTKDAAKKSGREAVSALLAELIDAGYIVRSEHQRHDAYTGHLIGYDYSVYDSPCAGLPTKAKPCKANPTLISNDLEQEMITATAKGDGERAARLPKMTGSNRTPNQPKPQEQTTMSVTWEPSSGFGARLVRAGKKPDSLTKELLAKFCAYYDGQERRQSQWEAELLSWVCLEIPEAQKTPKSKPANAGRVKNKYVNINDRDYGESGSF